MDFSYFESENLRFSEPFHCFGSVKGGMERSSICELVRTDDWYECRHCHVIQPLFVEAVNASSQSYYINMAYTPVTHFKSRLAQLQGKENKILPDHVLEKCKDCKTIVEIQKVLQEQHLPKYYKHKMKIAQSIGLVIPSLTRDEEDQILSIFRNKFPMVQTKNHIPYQYMLYKLMTLIGRKDVHPYLEITKDKKKLQRYHDIWSRVA